MGNENGVTAERVCGVCNEKIGFLKAVYICPEMRDNQYLCSKCLEKCSPILSYDVIKGWTKEDAVKHMNMMEDMKNRQTTELTETDSVTTNEKKPRKLIIADTQKGLWYVPGMPDIFSFDQIDSYEITLNLYNGEGSGIHKTFTPPRPDMPVPTNLVRLEGMNFLIHLKNHPYAEDVTVPIVDSSELFEMYKKYLDRAYGIALLCYEFMERNLKNKDGEITFHE